MQLLLPWFDRDLHPNARPHWTKKAKAVKKYREIVENLLQEQAFFAKSQFYELTIEIFQPNRRHHDIDGVLSSLKPAIDQIADHFGFNDKNILKISAIKSGVDCAKKGFLHLTLTRYEPTQKQVQMLPSGKLPS